MKQILTWRQIQRIILATPRAILFGPPGTGKTYAATHVDGTVYSLTLHEGSSADEIRGHFLPTGGGTYRWHDGTVIRAWRESHNSPVTLVVNEIDRASDEVKTLLYAVADDPDVARLTLPTGETVQPGPFLRLIMTTNAEPDVLGDALASRFPVQIYIDQPAPEAIRALPQDLQTAAQASTTDPDPSSRINLRSWHAFAALRDRIDAKLAARAVFGVRADDILNSIALASAATVPDRADVADEAAEATE